MSELNIAIIGAGYIAHYHARGLLEQEGVRIKAVCGLDAEALGAFAKKYDIEVTTADALELAGREDIDAAVICTPNKFHAPYAIAFMEQGKDVFLEKPMTVDGAEARQVAEVAEAHERIVMVGHMWRFDTEADYVKGIVESGKIGRVVKTKGYGIHANWGPSGWFAEKELAGGGALADMGVHAIDTVRYLLGDPKPESVYARIGTYFGDYDVDDTGMLMITWDNGTVSLIESGWWQPHSDGPEAATGVFGTKGYAHLFPTKYKTAHGENPGEFIPRLPERSEHCDQVIYTRQMAHFVECLRSRKTPCPGLAEGEVIVEIVEAAYTSARENRVVRL